MDAAKPAEVATKSADSLTNTLMSGGAWAVAAIFIVLAVVLSGFLLYALWRKDEAMTQIMKHHQDDFSNILREVVSALTAATAAQNEAKKLNTAMQQTLASVQQNLINNETLINRLHQRLDNQS